MRLHFMGLACVLVGCVSDPNVAPDGGNMDSGGSDALTNDSGGGPDSGADVATDAGPTCGNGAYDWHFSGGANLGGGLSATAVDAMGNTFAMGTYFGTPDFGKGMLPSGGQSDVVLLKLDPKGKLIWNVPIYSPGNDLPGGIAVDGAGDAYVTVNSNGVKLNIGSPQSTQAVSSNNGYQSAIIKIKGDGSPNWSNVISSTEVFCPQVAANGTRLAIGCNFKGANAGVLSSTTSTPNSDPVHQDIIVAEISNGGMVQWVKRIGGGNNGASGNDVATGIAIDAQGGVVIAGTIGSSNPTFESSSLTRVGATSSRNAMLLWLDPSGALSRQQLFGAQSVGEAGGGNVVLDPMGNAFFVGRFKGTVGFNGMMLTSVAGNKPCGGYDSYLMQNTMPPCTDGFVLAIDKNNGQPFLSKQFGGPQDDTADTVAIGPCGVLVAGVNRSANLMIEGKAVDSPSADIQSNGPWAMYMANYTLPNNQISWVKGYVSADTSAAVNATGIAYAGPSPRMTLGLQGSTKLDGTNVFTSPYQGQGLVVLGLKP